MDKCAKCGHWLMYYSQARGEWVCNCYTCIPQTCSCNHTIKESVDKWGSRLLAQNQKGRYSVDPPLSH